MTRPTVKTATMMAETAVLTSTLITVLNASVIMKIIVGMDILHLWLMTVFVITRLTMHTVTMMAETVVSLLNLLIYIGC